jgi:osmotically-inducible protein OsmY
MPIWELNPLEPADPNWEASSHRGRVLIRARDEQEARAAAQKAFGVKTRFRPRSGIKAPPWKRPDIVSAKIVEAGPYAPEGPTEILFPVLDELVFESDDGHAHLGSQAVYKGMCDMNSVLDHARHELRSERRVDPHRDHIALAFDAGVMTVEGEVSNVAAKKCALERIAAIPEVAGIVDRLRVKPAAPMGDAEIRDHLRDALLSEPALANIAVLEIVKGEDLDVRQPPDGTDGHIRLRVENGVVTLDGDVPGLAQKRLAGILAWWVPGSRDVVNGLGVTPPEDDNDAEITEAVRIALEKDPFVDASQIRAATSNAVVTLTGLVSSEAERDMAEFDAWYVFGADQVINRIEVRR